MNAMELIWYHFEFQIYSNSNEPDLNENMEWENKSIIHFTSFHFNSTFRDESSLFCFSKFCFVNEMSLSSLVVEYLIVAQVTLDRFQAQAISFFFFLFFFFLFRC